MITHEKATDKNIITKQVVINTPTSARLLPITADKKVIDEIQQALNELERLKKIEKLLGLYREHHKLVPFMTGLGDKSKRVIAISIEIKQLEKELEKLK